MRKKARSRFRLRKKPSQARAVATVDAIIEATARILVARGYIGLTTNHVAERAGVSVGTLYEYFPGKEALVASVMDRHLEEAEALLAGRGAQLAAGALAMEPIEATRALATVMVELHEDDPRLHRVLTEEVPHPPETSARVRALEDRMVDVLAAVIDAHPRITSKEPAVAARMVVGLLEAATHQWATDREGMPLPRDVLIEELAQMIAAYLTTPPAQPTRDGH